MTRDLRGSRTFPGHFRRARPTVIIAVVFLAVLVLAGAGAVIYDSTRNDLIAKGVTVGGVDVGGLRADQARTRLQDELLTPLNRAVTIRAARRTFELSPADARIRADIDGMVDAAVQRSRSGSIFTRVARSVTGGEVPPPCPPRSPSTARPYAGWWRASSGRSRARHATPR